ncbi:hypothetical protein BGZ76_004724, partial [Entomortierella beljakovae]
MSFSTRNAKRVLIVGAGLGGLLMAILLEKMDIPYTVFERASTIKPLGSVMSLNTSILPLFEQLGILEAVKCVSKLYTEINLYDTQRNSLGSISAMGCREVNGYNSIVLSRPDFYCILLSMIPSDKIKLNKRIVRIENKQKEAILHCSDNSIYYGNIIVGADGAYSTVRQDIYQQLAREQKLPASDAEEMKTGYICIVGVTDAQRQEKYPGLRGSKSQFRQTLDNDTSSWHVATLPGNRLGWGISSQFTFNSGSNDQRFQNSEWNPESNEAVLKRYRDSPNNYGSTMGELIDATPKSAISTVYLEERLFETWYHGRTVLIGDACHKMLPQSGQGAINAMQDAVVLSNCIYSMNSTTMEGLQAVFRSYKEQRYTRAKNDIADSMFKSRLMTSQQWSDRLMRKLMFQYLPTWATTSSIPKYQPQAVFLPSIIEKESKQQGIAYAIA